MHSLNQLSATAREREIARAAREPGRLMAHEWRLAAKRRRGATSGAISSASEPDRPRKGGLLAAAVAISTGRRPPARTQA